LVFLRGRYGIVKPLPVVPGFECSGTVVSTGGGLWGRWLLGRRVACHAPADGNGTWADYMIVSAKACIPLKKYISDEQGANLTVNPMTAMAFVDIIRSHDYTAFVQTAASSALGHMLARLGLRHKLTGIHIVRRPEQVRILKGMGCDYVFDQNDALFIERLGEACYKFKARIAFDAVGGELTQRIAAAMLPGSRVIVYGALSGEECKINPTDLIFNRESLEGFWLTQWIKTKNFFRLWDFTNRIQRLIPTDLSTTIQARFSLTQFAEAIALYKKQRSTGKVLIVPHARN
jgi:NADPH:quinone reductase-like Zn-dependent oxidoreductase